MKYLSFYILICLFTAFLACDKEKQVKKTACIQLNDDEYLDNYGAELLCTSDICQKYEAIWKELFLEKNSLTDSYFNEHVILCHSNTNTCTDGILFSICYKVKIDWAIAWNCDQFIIKIEKGNNLYPSISIPRDEYLSKDDIRTAIANGMFSSTLTNISNAEILKFKSNAIALEKLKSESSVNNLCFNSTFINEATGHMTLEAHAQYMNESNLCIIGTIDLINGSTMFIDTPCRID